MGIEDRKEAYQFISLDSVVKVTLTHLGKNVIEGNLLSEHSYLDTDAYRKERLSIGLPKGMEIKLPFGKLLRLTRCHIGTHDLKDMIKGDIAVVVFEYKAEASWWKVADGNDG